MGKCRLFVACSMIGHLYFSGTWFDVAPRTNTKKTCVGNIVRYVGLCVGNMITIVGSIASQQNGGGGPIDHFNKHENSQFDKEQASYELYEVYEESSYGLNLDLLTIL